MIHIKGQKNGINSHPDFWAIECSIHEDFNWAYQLVILFVLHGFYSLFSIGHIILLPPSMLLMNVVFAQIKIIIFCIKTKWRVL